MLHHLKLLGRWPTLRRPISTPFRKAAATPEELLHRNFNSSNAQAHQHDKLSATVNGGHRRAKLSTLDPNKLCPTDYVTTLPNGTSFNLYFQGQNGRSRINYGFGDFRFPHDARGFFYFHKDAKQTIVQASLRFRIAEGPNHADFQKGRDLTVRKDTGSWPWSLNILQIIQSYPTLLSQLLEEGLLSQEERHFCQRVTENSGIRGGLSGLARLPVISHPSEPFVVDLSHKPRIFLLDTEKAELLLYNGPPLLGATQLASPYRGKCLVRFEPTSHRTSKGSVIYHIRVLKTLSAIERTGISSTVVFPQENSLLSRNKRPIKHSVSFKIGSSQTLRPKSISAETISTLDSSRLQPSDMVNAAGTVACQFGFASGQSRLRYFNRNTFPAEAKGFLYFHRDLSRPAMSGELRFRLTTRPDQKAFEEGYDLTKPEPYSSEPWSIPLLRLVHYKDYRSVVSQLLLDGLVSEEDVQRCKEAFYGRRSTRFWSSKHCFHGIGDTTVLDFSAPLRYLHLLTGDPPTIHVCRDAHAVTSRHIRQKPYVGKCLVRLEEAKDRGFRGEKCFVLRVVKILEPFKYMDYNDNGPLALPIEGTYLRRWGQPLIINNFDPPVF